MNGKKLCVGVMSYKVGKMHLACEDTTAMDRHFDVSGLGFSDKTYGCGDCVFRICLLRVEALLSRF